MFIYLILKKYGFRPWNKENVIHGIGSNKFVKIKNTDKNEPEIEVKINGSQNQNGWSLPKKFCFYVKFN